MLDSVRKTNSASKRSSLLLQEQIKILRMIAREDPFIETLTAITNFAESLSRDAVAGVTIVDRSDQSLEMAVFPSLAPAFANSIAGVPLAPPHVGTCAQALYRGEVVTSENLAIDGRFAEVWRQLCADHGIQSCCSYPVRSEQSAPLGTFMLCFPTPRKASTFDQQLIKICADLVELTLGRRRVDQYRTLQTGELKHRQSNIFASVSALARFTSQSALDKEDFNASFQRRLEALRHAHSLMFDADGAELTEILQQVLGVYGERSELTGPRIMLTPHAASSLSMAFHELATNAVKYGALSNNLGSLHIAWDTGSVGGDDILTLKWIEQDGPKISAPTRIGFGRRAIERMLAGEIDARARMEFPPEGLRCEIRAPISAKLVCNV